MTAREMHEKEAQHSSDQREENNVLLRSMAGMMKIIGGAVIMLLFSAICVGVADHYKLIAVAELVTRLTASTDRAANETYARNEAHAAWRANLDNALTVQKAEVLALANRVALLESEVRSKKQ